MRKWMPVRSITGELYLPSMSKPYEFLREEWDAPVVKKLEDFHPAMNIMGLMWREVTENGESDERVAAD